MLYLILWGLLMHDGVCMDVPVDINVSHRAALVDSNFLSVSLGFSAIKRKFKDFDFHSEKLLTLAKGLTMHENQAGIYFRIGGADRMKFNPEMFILNTTEFNELCEFVYTLQWKLVFGLNVLLRKKDNTWDPTNAIQLIDYALKKGFCVQYELGNEPDLFPKYQNITIPPLQLAADFKTLCQILNDKTHHQSKLIGPDVATLDRYNYFENVLSNMDEGVLDAVSFHHYYSSSEDITVLNFTSVQYLDTFLNYGLYAFSIIVNSFSGFLHPPVWIGETSSTYGGGTPGVGESFASGFVWLDKLGLAAQMGIKVVIRQGLKGGHYSLLDKHYDPNPDYWSSSLYKQLMGRTVLDVTGFLTYNRTVRIYAHCVNQFDGHHYKPNSIVLMALNLNSTDTANIYLTDQLKGLQADQYIFSPANGKLIDKNIKLNGYILKMINDTMLPEMKPVRVSQPYRLPPLTYGYFVLLDSYAVACEDVEQ